MGGLLGATIIAAGASNPQNIVSAYNAWGTLVTPPQSGKVYFSPNEFPLSDPSATAYFQMGMRACLTYKPTYNNLNASMLSALVASVQSFQAQAAAAGAPAPVIALWQEPQNAQNMQQYGLSATTFLSIVAYCAPSIRNPYVAGVSCGLKLCYDGSGQSPNLAASWFPGPPNINPLTGLAFTAPIVDIVAADFYGGDFVNGGKTLANWLYLASGQNGLYPPLPFGIWECGNAASPTVIPQAGMVSYLQYLISVMAPLAAVGLADAVMWYQDEQAGFSGVNVIPNSVSELVPGDPNSDFRIAYLLQALAALNPGSPVGAQPLTVPDFSLYAGTRPTPAVYNSLIQAPFSFLTSKVVFRAQLNSNPAGGAGQLSPNQVTVIPFDTVLEDPLSGWNPATFVWQCPPGMSGTYLVSITAAAQGASDNVSTLQAVPLLNGGTVYTLSNTWMPQGQIGMACGDAPLALSGGQDQVSAGAYWNGGSGSSLSTLAGRRCSMEITWQGL